MDKSRLNMTLNNLANFIKTQSINSFELSSPKDEDLSGNLASSYFDTNVLNKLIITL